MSPIASGIFKLEKVIGTIPNVLCKGAIARKVLQKLLRYRCDESDQEGNLIGSDTAGEYIFCLFIYVSIGLSVCLCDCLSVYLSVSVSVCVSVRVTLFLSLCLSVCMSVCMYVCLTVWLAVCVSV